MYIFVITFLHWILIEPHDEHTPLFVASSIDAAVSDSCEAIDGGDDGVNGECECECVFDLFRDMIIGELDDGSVLCCVSFH